MTGEQKGGMLDSSEGVGGSMVLNGMLPILGMVIAPTVGQIQAE